MKREASKSGYQNLKRLSPHSTGKSVCGESRTHGLEWGKNP